MAETSSVLIRAGRPDEGPRLKAIAIAAKASWGYEPERVRDWADGGDFTPAGLSKLTVFVAEHEDDAIGWASFVPKDDVGRLEDLWIEPSRMRIGIGAQLFRHAAEHARQLGATRLEWEAEPNAVGFYEKMGARPLRETVSEWGRTLTIMGVDLDG